MAYRLLILNSLSLLTACTPTLNGAGGGDPLFSPGQTWVLSFPNPNRAAAKRTLDWAMTVGPRTRLGDGAFSYAYSAEKVLEIGNETTFSYHPGSTVPAYAEAVNAITLPDRTVTQFCIVRTPRLSVDNTLTGVLISLSFKSRTTTDSDLPQALIGNYLRTGWNDQLDTCTLKKSSRSEVVEA